MRLFCPFMCATLAVMVSVVIAQLPPRLQIPGAVLLTQAKPVPFRTRAHLVDSSPTPRVRGRPPIQNTVAAPIPVAPIRPVVEEAEEAPIASPQPSTFDEEVNKLGISALTSAVRQAVEPEEEIIPTPPRPVAFRPERPVPVLRQDIRDNTVVLQRPAVFRQEPRENIPRQLVRQEIREQEIPISRPIPQPVRHAQVRQQAPQAPPQIVRQPQARISQPPPRQQQIQYTDEGVRGGRTRKPPVQILRKYRTDNPDGSITWGYENEDGSFKEETLGIDCMVRGKYGYVDPDGVRREYSYETGNKCDQPELDEDDVVLQGKQPQAQPRKPQARPYLAQSQYN